MKHLVIEAGVYKGTITYAIRSIALDNRDNERDNEAAYRYLHESPDKKVAPSKAWNWWVVPSGTKKLYINYYEDEQIIGFSADDPTNKIEPTKTVVVDLTSLSEVSITGEPFVFSR